MQTIFSKSDMETQIIQRLNETESLCKQLLQQNQTLLQKMEELIASQNCITIIQQNQTLQQEMEELIASQNCITISLADACKRLGISRGTMMSRLKKGMFPYAWQDVGGQWRFPLDKLMRYGSCGC